MNTQLSRPLASLALPNYLATTRWLLAVLFLLPGLAYAQNVLDTGAILTEVFDVGFVGTDPSFAGIGFDFNGDNGLYVGEALVGIGGSCDSQAYGGFSEFTNTSPTASFTPGGIFSYFDTGWATSFSSPLGVTLHQEAYALSGSNDQFIVFNLCAENTSGGNLQIYLGYYVDWDIGNFAANLGDASGNLVYTWDEDGISPNFFGFSPIGGDVLSGWTVSSSTDDAGMYTEMVTLGTGSETHADRRNVMGVDVGIVSNGGIECAIFAWAAGTNLADLEASVAAAEVAIPVELLSFDFPQGYLLSAPYPNPFNPRAVVPFEVPETAHVRLTLVDIFGREVATLLDRQVAPGSHEAVVDGGHLASGVYLVRLEAEGVVHASQKVLLLR